MFTARSARMAPSDRLLITLLYILLWGYTAFAVLTLFGSPVGEFDDSIPLLHGLLVLQGRTPNLDFYSFYPPLSFYVNAAAFHLLGQTVLAVRLVSAFLYVAVLLLIYRFFRAQFAVSPLLVPLALLLVATAIGAAPELPVWPGFALSLLALATYLYAQDLGRHRLPLIAVSGLLAAVALLYRINFGCYVVAIIVCDLFLSFGFSHRRARFNSSLVAAAAFTLPLAACSAAFCLSIYGRNTAVAVQQFIVTAQKVMATRSFVRLEFHADVACAVVFPAVWFFFRMLRGVDQLPMRALIPAAIGLCLLRLTIVLGTQPAAPAIILVLELATVTLLHLFVQRLQRSELAFLLLFCCLVHYFLSRADWFHWRLLPIAAALLLPFLLLSGKENTKPRPATTAIGTSFAVLAAAIFVLTADRALRPASSHARIGASALATLVLHPPVSDTAMLLGLNAPPPAWAKLYPDVSELQALRYVRARTSRNDPIFVGVGDTSRVFWNTLRTYWLADRRIGARTFELEWKVATDPAVQTEIISDLNGNAVNWIILDQVPQQGDATYAETNYRGSTLLDSFIAANYTQQARFGRYAVLSRK